MTGLRRVAPGRKGEDGIPFFNAALQIEATPVVQATK
jgi:hypothetical protein